MVDRSLWFRILYPVVFVFGHILLFFLGPVRIRNRQAVPRHGGLLILANHISDVDPVIVQAACPRPIFFMGKSELFELRWLAPVIRWFGTFPVRRGEPDRAAIKFAVDKLKRGGCVCIFPEGKLSEDGKLQELLPGVALIARMAGVPVLCCGLEGTSKIMPYGMTFPRPAFGGVTAAWGTPRTFASDDSADSFLDWIRDDLLRLTHSEALGSKT